MVEIRAFARRPFCYVNHCTVIIKIDNSILYSRGIKALS